MVGEGRLDNNTFTPQSTFPSESSIYKTSPALLMDWELSMFNYKLLEEKYIIKNETQWVRLVED